MSESVKIIGVYSTKKDGGELITTSGKRFINLLLKPENEDEGFYQALYLSERAYFVIENFFKACGKEAPNFDSLSFADIANCEGEEVRVITEVNNGYKGVKKWFPKATASVEDTKPLIQQEEPVQENLENDPDLDEDIPF
jgi:hypothetical protein